MSDEAFPIEVAVFVWRTKQGYRVEFALAAGHQRLTPPVKLPRVFDSEDAAREAAMKKAKSARRLLASAPLTTGSYTYEHTRLMHRE